MEKRYATNNGYDLDDIRYYAKEYFGVSMTRNDAKAWMDKNEFNLRGAMGNAGFEYIWQSLNRQYGDEEEN